MTNLKKLWLAALTASGTATAVLAWRTWDSVTASASQCLGQSAEASCSAHLPLLYASGVSALLMLFALVCLFRPPGDSAAARARFWPFAVFVVSIAIALVPSRGKAPANQAAQGSHATPLEVAATATPDNPISSPTTDSSVLARHPFPHVPTTRHGMPLESDPFIANSQEEQAWLDRHGYPNLEQWQQLLQASDSQLREAADAGDSVAKALFNQRRLLGGDEAALEDMIDSAASGSTFSLDLLSSTLAASPEDRVMAYALSRVVEMRGNFRVAAGRDVMFSQPLSSSERLQAENDAIEMFNVISELQKKKLGAQRPVVDPRPIGGT